MIEDAMIAANEAVARFLTRDGFTSIYRVHDHPNAEKLEALKHLAAIIGYPLHLPEEVQPRDYSSFWKRLRQ